MKDYLHFYVFLAAIPLSLVSLYAYIFIGDAELSEIPEGYIPYPWEYEKVEIFNF